MPQLVEEEHYDKKEDNYIMIRLLINKTPFVFTLVKSLTMLLTMNDNTNTIGQTYISSLFHFLSFYVHKCPDNCLFILSSKILKSFLLLNIENLPTFIDLFEYMIRNLKESNICLSQNNSLVKVVEQLIEKISDKSEYIHHFHKLLAILNKLCHMSYFHQEHTMNKIRKNILLDKRENKTLKERIDNKEMVGNYIIEHFMQLFTKFMKIVNFMFDGNSTLNENEFLSKIFNSDEILDILKDLSLYLPLRIELIKFYRLAYMDIIIDTKRLKKYVEIFSSEIKATNQTNSNNFLLFQQLLKVNQDVQYLDNGVILIEYELKNYKQIFKENQSLNKKFILLYFENCVILPLNVYLNTYVSMIYNFDGYKYIKFFEMIFYLLVVKIEILEEMKNIEADIEKWKQSNSEEVIENRAYYIIYQKF